MMNKEQYMASLQKLHPIIYCNGKRIENVVEDPMTRPHVNSAAMTYELACDPAYENLMTATSSLTGKKINRFTHLHQSAEDLVKKVKMLRMIAQKTGTCFQRCVGLDAMNATYIVTHKIDRECGTNYHERFTNFMKYVQENDFMVAGSMTDPKGDRSKKPGDQVDPDLYVHIVEKKKDGIIVRGAKAHQTGMVNSHMMLILPTTNLGKNDKDYAVACAIPVDAEGVTHIFGRQTNDTRRLEGDIDTGNSEYAIVGGETLTVMDNVFVPWEHVFMCGEYQYAQEYVEKFASYHRQNYGGCKVGVADVIIGATATMAEYNGCPKASHIKDKIIEMIHMQETMYNCSLGCSYEGTKTEAGTYYVNTLLANTVKLNCTRYMYEISRLAHDIAGGFIATLPYEKDLKNRITGPLIKKYFAANPNVTTENRIRMARLLENMTGGTALAESMHGAGSPQAMRIMLYRETNIEGKKKMAKQLAKIKED
ncbi:4-hydroxyphenylacetate 3-hydroxylase family protein [Megasphaera paucivorans]|uniref:Vinylacetyl-CoA delta-isomerase n=1 Tax=Megasphaera paucivorans TaxID=349095 RepID=A0A1G9WXA3_9FIRM|nr:4-hydroxyphenylacetate 3-hydroxylase family protein [Megasphaera paucivorans]SDM88715.1 vinylacetyl-CoA delta-isomerase [Megasphaera paucivorans]